MNDTSAFQITLPRDLSLTAGALVGAITFAALSPWAIPKRKRHPRLPELRWPDRLAMGRRSKRAEVLSDVMLFAGIAVPLLDRVRALGKGKALRDELLVWGQGLAFESALSNATKCITRRPLPRVRSWSSWKLMKSPRGYRSFFSGHDALFSVSLSSWAVAASLRGQGTVRWVLLPVLSALLGYGRVKAGKHYPSDVVVGGLMGTAIGTGTALAHAKRKEERSGEERAPRAQRSVDGIVSGWDVRLEPSRFPQA